MDVLVDMGREELKEIGVNTYGARHKIVKKIKELTTRGAVGEYCPVWPTSHQGSEV